MMYELEKYDQHPIKQKLIKSTNYINYTNYLSKSIEIQNVIYFQFNIEDLHNHRILWDGNLIIHATDHITFHMNTHYRFDKNGESFFEFSNGLGIQF